MAQFGSIITNIGLAKISNAQITNSTIGIESMVLGDGNGAYYTVSQSQTALRNEVWRGLLADQRIDANNPNRIEFSAFIPSTVGGFTIREVGLLDTDGNLIALSLYPEQYKPTLGEGISDDILIHFVIETSNASVITLAVDVTNVIATRQYVDRKTEEVNDVLTTHLDEMASETKLGHVKIDNETITINEDGVISAVGFKHTIYGVKIDTLNSNPETALTYTDDAIGFTPASGNNGAFDFGSWQDKFPFNQIRPCLYRNNSVVGYLNPNDYTKFEDGSLADITSGNSGDVMIEFPQVWWKIEQIGTDLFIKYSDVQVDSSWRCLAHKRGESDKFKVYIGAYLGSELNGKLRSLSGKTPTGNKTLSAFRTIAQANGGGFDLMAYYQLLMLQVLYIVMFKNLDSQTALGRGYVDGNSSSIITGGTNTKGMFYGETSGKQQLKFCGVEDFYGNLRQIIDGFYIDASRNILIGNQNFNDTGVDYSNFGQGAAVNTGGYIKSVQGKTNCGFVIKEGGGSNTTYYTDQGQLNASTVPFFGAGYSSGNVGGVFHFMNVAISNADAANGSRLMVLI